MSATQASPASGQPASGQLVSGQIPPLAEVFIARTDTGLGSTAGLPLGATVVLAPAGAGGAGGTGKTQLAATLARALAQEEAVSLIVWITAVSRDAVITGYAQALRDLGVPAGGESAEQAAGRFAAWLATASQPWLVVLDDLRQGALPDGLWPGGPAGRVLVTTEHPEATTGLGPQVVPVGPFTPREALSYLGSYLHTDNIRRTGALELATDLGCWPLALAQAAALMTLDGSGCPEYRSRLAAHRARRAGSPEVSGPAGLVPAWELAVTTADSVPPGGMAGRALALISMLAPHGVPGLVLTSDAACGYLTGQQDTPADRSLARQAVTNLARLGLATVDARSASATVLVHPAVQAITREYLPAGERRRAALAAARALLQIWALPDVPAGVAQRLRECTASLHGLAQAALWTGGCHPVLIQAGRSLTREGPDGRAADYWQSLLTVSEQALGSGHAHTVLIRDELGAACEAAGRLGDAIALYERTLGEHEHSPGGEPDTWTARVALARAYRAAGRGTDAIALARDAMADVQSRRGPESDQLTAGESLARAYLAAEQYGEAVAAFREVLAARERLQGRDHPMTLAARAELADACRAAGRPKEAITLCQRTLSDCEQLRGPGHPDTVAAQAGLAAAFYAAKKPKQAIPLYEQVLADRQRELGPDHADTISAGSGLASAYMQAGRLAQAVSQYEQTVAACARVFGPAHDITRVAAGNLNAAVAQGLAVRGIDLRSSSSQ